MVPSPETGPTMEGRTLLMRILHFGYTEDLQDRIYNKLILIELVAGPLIVLGNAIQGLHPVAVISPVFLTAVYAVLLYLSMARQRRYKFLLCFSLLAFIVVQWIYNGGGSSGGMQYFFLWTFVAATILLQGPPLVIYITLNCLALLGLLLYEYYDGSIIVPYANETARLVDVIVSAALTFILASFIVRAIYAELDKERNKSDALLLNILPRKVISELKQSGQTRPEIFQEVTVLFSDIVGFTNISARLPVDILIEELNDLFTIFDNIAERNACERIKTIGDAYLAVCGLPVKNEKHTVNVVNAALEMMRALEDRNRHHPLQWQIRIGIHTGQAIGSVVGTKKYIYDVFGDTVNTASRLQTCSRPMKVNVSAEVADKVRSHYRVEERGPMQVKGKKEMEMYFIDWPGPDGRHPPAPCPHEKTEIPTREEARVRKEG